VTTKSTDDLVEVLSALADPVRLGIVRCLADSDELAGTTLADRLGVSRALLCHHSAILVKAGLVTRRKQGQVGYLRLNAKFLRGSLKRLIAETV
jgi:DNA-binding transcriptional ArsR family regulator